MTLQQIHTRGENVGHVGFEVNELLSVGIPKDENWRPRVWTGQIDR